MMLDRREASQETARFDWIRGALEASGELLYEWDLDADAILWAGRPAGIFGRVAAAELSTGGGFARLIHAEDLALRRRMLSEHLATGAPYDCEYRVRTAGGRYAWVHDRGQARFSPDGAPSHLIGSLRLVTRRKQNDARLERLASFDELTGHFNKTRLRDALDHALARCHRFDRTGGFLVLGIDKLAMINSAFGHRAGDSVLIAVGRRLDLALGGSGTVGRVDADRFGILLEQTSAAELARIAERLLRAVREQPVELLDTKIPVTASIGAILLPQPAATGLFASAQEVIARAETALKDAKLEGGDGFAFYRLSAGQDRQHRRSLDIVARVQRAIRENRLLFAFQPVIDSQSVIDGRYGTNGTTQRPAFHECLLRLRDERGELMPAGDFVPVIEQLGLVRRMDRHVLELAIDELRRSPEATLAVNISGHTANDRAWLRALLALLRGESDLARRLIVEITETAALHDIDESARFVAAVRDLGCRVAVDDFGAGFTSFRHLKALNADLVKLDGSFIRNLAGNRDNQHFVRNIVAVAQALGMETVAECVETAEDAAFLVGEGVRYLQGHLFGRPELRRPWLPALPDSVAVG